MDGLSSGKPSVEVLFTPKKISSDATVIMNKQDARDAYCRKLREFDMSQNRLLRAITGKIQVSDTDASFTITASTAALSRVSIPSPSHFPEATVSKKSVIVQHSDEKVDHHCQKGPPRRRISFKVGDGNLTPSTEDCRNLNTPGHLPRNVRNKAFEQLFLIRDDIVEIVTFLYQIGYGGKDFKWSVESLKPYGVTKIDNIHIPDAFLPFTETTPSP